MKQTGLSLLLKKIVHLFLILRDLWFGIFPQEKFKMGTLLH